MKTSPAPAHPDHDYPVASRMRTATSSAIRDLLKHASHPGMISLAGGLPASDLFDAEALHDAASAVLKDEPRKALQYGPTEGQPVLREQLARCMAERGVPVHAQRIVVTAGSQQAIDLLARVLLDPGDAVVVERPSYLAAIQAFGLAQARILSVPGDADGMDIEALDELLKRERPKFIYVISNFANPSGATICLSRRRRLLELAVRHGVFVLEDDPYGQLRWRGEPIAPLAALARELPGAEHWCGYLSTLSKSVAPGLRTGWLVLPEGLHGLAVLAKQAMDLHTSTLTQLIAARYLASNRLELRLPVICAAYRQREQALSRSLDLGGAIRCNRPDGGMFVWATLDSAVDAGALLEHAVAKGVIFVPGAPFYAQAPRHNTLRLSFATCTPEQIDTGIARLALAMQEYAAGREPERRSSQSTG